MTVQQLLLRGAPGDLVAAMDRLYIHSTVLGVVSLEDSIEVAVEVGAGSALPILDSVEVEVWTVDPEDAEVTGLENDRALLVGDSILVRPPWVEAPAGFDGVELVVSRGMAFGSGEHGSTRAALCSMEKVLDLSEATDWTSCADIGTGSGILAAYAAARGVPNLHACDIDEDAVRAARDLLPDADIRVGGPDELPGPFDIVVANMRASEIRGCLDGILTAWNRRGPLILSGLRPDEADTFDVVAGATPSRIEVDGFVALTWRLAWCQG